MSLWTQAHWVLTGRSNWLALWCLMAPSDTTLLVILIFTVMSPTTILPCAGSAAPINSSVFFSPYTGMGGLRVRLNDFGFKGTGIPFVPYDYSPLPGRIPGGKANPLINRCCFGWLSPPTIRLLR